ncbi:glycoside hydrolase family 1 [Rhodococcus sp. 06-235-1A]|uniref:family 1 glycosylhydrolase n=1 Tax=Rhodococcus sp. 06-235-1A TaxID=2022508 RepID=UPI000B9B3ABD|nr:family 1 glycosylhydrolase [Rhodococcus sp. 06-235-1A]OZD06558.1 glycoside hydrolase family 1 [Rhodococcus sp. 06-235-1A]
MHPTFHPGGYRRRLTRLLVPVVAAAAAFLVVAPAQAEAPEQVSSASEFGPDFMWGTASSGFQSEGTARDSNWTRYVDRGLTEEPIGDTVDFFNRYREDIQLAAGLGTKVYRISVEWSRVQPTPESWDESGLAFYDSVVQTIVDAGMQPMITLDHWVYPGWEVDRGGWKNPSMVADWLANATKVVDRFAPYNPIWITINEPTSYTVQEARFGGIGVADIPMMFDRLSQAHNAIYDHIHLAQPGAMVSSNVAYIPGINAALDTQFIDKVADKLDFVGIDYYVGLSVQNPNLVEPLLTAEMWNAPTEPEGVYYALRHYSKKFPNLPLFIVETGLYTEGGSRPDGYRSDDALRDSVYWVQRAKMDGMNVVGYNYWSLTDNYEWGSYTPRMGLYAVDVQSDPTLSRRPTAAVPAYREVIANNGVGADYRPTRAPAQCSLVDPLPSCTEPVSVPGR